MLAFYTKEDRGDHYGVYEQSYAGWSFVRLYKDQIDLNKGYICGIPVIEKSSYKEPRISFSGSNISVMHGSKRGIQASHGNRVSEYDYYFSWWLGKRFANYVKRTGKKILVVKTSKQAPCTHEQYQNICNDEFQRGFNDESGGYDSEARVSQSCRVDCNYKGRNARWDGALIYSDLYVYCHDANMEKDITRKARDVIRDMAEIDMLEKQKGRN